MSTVEIRIEQDYWGRSVLKHGARFDVSLDRLGDILGLPEGARVVGIWGGVSQQTFERTVAVMVEHPDLPGVLEGGRLSEITPTFEWCDMEGKEILSDWGV